jgi:hypothetical protein
MSIRSKTTGDSDEVPVSTRGGKPTHKKNQKKNKAEAPRQTLAKFCIKCGM